MKNFISSCNHLDSFLSASTIDKAIDKAASLGNEYVTITDHGYLTGIMKAYKIAEKKKLKIIPGVELYFKDPDCEVAKNSQATNFKYFKIVIHTKDQEAYQELVKLSSYDRTKRTVEINEHLYNLHDWKDLIHLSKYNVTVTTSDVECLVSKYLLINRPDLAERSYLKLKELFKDNFYPSIIPIRNTEYWSQVVEISLSNGQKLKVAPKDRVTIEEESRCTGISLFNRFRHGKPCTLTGVAINGVVYGIKNKSQLITNVKYKKDFQSIGSDLQLTANKFVIEMATKYNDLDRLLISSYAYYADKEDIAIQNMKLSDLRQVKHSQYMQSNEDCLPYLREIFSQNEQKIADLIENTHKWANLFIDFKLKYDYRLPDHGEKPAKDQIIDTIKKVGRMKWDNPQWVKQLREELDILTNNGVKDLCPYFLPLNDILQANLDNGKLTGVARGSAGGFLISYLMGITQIDPIKYGLSSSRFITKDRIQEGGWPDIDCDFEDRDFLVGKDGNSGYLYGKYGKKAAQISTRGQLRLKSSILDVNRYLNGEVEEEIESFAKALPSTPQGISDYDFIYGYKDGDGNIIPGLIETNKDLQKYIDNRKNEWEMVLKCLALTRQFSKHASAYLVSDTDIENTLPIFKVGETDRVTQYEAKESETVGMVKYDFLVVKNLKDIRLCMDLINKKNKVTKKTGYFQHNNEEIYIWDLPHDKGVYSDLSEGKTETVFQLSTTSVTPFVQKIRPESIEDLAVITALVRPGPLDYIDESTGRNMAEEYIYRRNGLSKSDLPILEKLLPETYGTLVYQEQVTKIAKEVGLMTVSEAENVRIAMGKKKIQLMNSLKPKFVAGATKTLNSAEDAEKLWSMLATFGRYGFNKSHSVAYVTIAYACAFLKHHYPLEWWSAILSNADDKEINENFYKYVKDILLPPDINISQEEIQIDYVNNTLRNKLSVISGMGDKAVGKIILNRPYKDIVDFVRKGVCGRALAEKLIFTRVLDSLFDPKDVLIDKLQKHANAIELVEHDKKIEKYKEKLAFEIDLKKKARIEKTLNKLLTSNPEAGTINPAYFGLTGIAVAKIQKTVIPTMRIDFNSLILKESKKVFHLPSNPPRIGVRGVRGEYQLIEPSFLEKIDAKTLTLSLTQQLSKTESKSFYFACAGYVLDVSEFSYQKNTKKALKILIDFSGFITEKVIWPDRETGELNRPKDLVKGSVATFIMYKQAEKKYTNILDIVIE